MSRNVGDIPKRELTNIVQDIFQLRANTDMTQKEIAKKVNMNEPAVCAILSRRSCGHVSIPFDHEVKVREKRTKRTTKKSNGATAPGPVTIKQPPTLASVIGEFTAAVMEMDGKEQKALDAGVNQEVLDMIKLAVREKNE